MMNAMMTKIIYYSFTIDFKRRTGLKWWSWTSTIKYAMCLRLGFGRYKMNVKLYVKVFFVYIGTLVLIGESLR